MKTKPVLPGSDTQPRCCATVRLPTSFPRYRQCSRPGRVERDDHWYCGIHDPKAAEERSRRNEERFAETRRYRRLSIAGPRIYEVLKDLVEKQTARSWREARKLIKEMEDK